MSDPVEGPELGQRAHAIYSEAYGEATGVHPLPWPNLRPEAQHAWAETERQLLPAPPRRRPPVGWPNPVANLLDGLREQLLEHLKRIEESLQPRFMVDVAVPFHVHNIHGQRIDSALMWVALDAGLRRFHVADDNGRPQPLVEQQNRVLCAALGAVPALRRRLADEQTDLVTRMGEAIAAANLDSNLQEEIPNV